MFHVSRADARTIVGRRLAYWVNRSSGLQLVSTRTDALGLDVQVVILRRPELASMADGGTMAMAMVRADMQPADYPADRSTQDLDRVPVDRSYAVDAYPDEFWGGNSLFVGKSLIEAVAVYQSFWAKVVAAAYRGPLQTTNGRDLVVVVEVPPSARFPWV